MVSCATSISNTHSIYKSVKFRCAATTYELISLIHNTICVGYCAIDKSNRQIRQVRRKEFRDSAKLQKKIKEKTKLSKTKTA